jgi:signal transduction histidine kinase
MERPAARRASGPALVVAFAFLAVLASGCALDDERGPGVHLLSQGRVIDTESEELPPSDAPGWRRVTLADVWKMKRRANATAGWYELPFLAEGPSDAVYGIYLPTFSLNAAVSLNGRAIGSRGEMGDPPTRNWNRPLYFTFPGSLLQPGQNVVQVRLRTGASSFGILSAVQVGPDEVLQPRYAFRHLLQVQVREMLTALVIAAGVLLGFVGFRARDMQGARWLAAAAILWAVSGADALIPNPPLPTRMWQWLSQLSLLGCAACTVLAAHRGAGVRRPRFEAALGIALLCEAVLYAGVPDLAVTSAAALNLVLAALCAVYLLYFLIEQRKQAFHLPAGISIGAATVTLLLVIHDLSLGAESPLPPRILLFPYVGSILLLVISMFVIRRFLRALQESEALNRELESRVEEKHQELERNYARLAQLERERVVVAERRRLTRDMHDGVGGQLVAALAMVERGSFRSEEIAHVLRDAIDDLRLVIDSIDPAETDLPAMLGLVRERLEPRLERHGVRFVWRVEDVPSPPGFGPHQALSALRIVQESITNVMRHARAATIEVRTGVVSRASQGLGVFLEVRDDGTGFEPSAKPGRGLANMRQRATDLGGVLDVESGPRGTLVRLWLPLDGPAPT